MLTASIPAVRAALAKRLPHGVKRVLLRLRHGDQLTARSRHEPTAGNVTAFDARSEQADALATVREAFSNSGVEFVELPRVSAFRPVLVVRRGAAAAAFSALQALVDAPQWTVRADDAHNASVRWRAAERRPEQVARLQIRRRVTAPNGREMSTDDLTISVELWEELSTGTANGDGAVYPPGSLRRRQVRRDSPVEYLAPETWREAVDTTGATLRLPAPLIRSVTEPIDLVYTWVDGDDPQWRAAMTAARGGVAPGEAEATALDDSRFTSRDELRFSLRSVEYYASWFNHIYLVTDGQVPAWLDQEHPRITVIDHRDLFKDPSVLPVFNSHAIESQLHRIEGLSERYVYLNDDVFFMRPTDPELFFEGNGVARFFPSVVPLDVRSGREGDLPVMSAAKNGRQHLVERHGRTVSHRFQHTPHPQVRSVLQDMEREAPGLFSQVAASRFRSPDDYSIASSLHHHEAYVRGRAVPGELNYQFIDLASPDRGIRLDRASRNRSLDILCINESSVDPKHRDDIESEVAQFLEQRFPVPSSFELPCAGAPHS